MKRFILGRSRLEDKGAAAIAKAFKVRYEALCVCCCLGVLRPICFQHIRTLEEVIIGNNGIKIYGSTLLLRAFAHCPNLKVSVLFQTKI